MHHRYLYFPPTEANFRCYINSKITSALTGTQIYNVLSDYNGHGCQLVYVSTVINPF